MSERVRHRRSSGPIATFGSQALRESAHLIKRRVVRFSQRLGAVRWHRTTSATIMAMAMLASIDVTMGPAAANDILRRGEYLVTIMDCSGCHTDGALIGAPDPTKALAGSRIGFRVPGLGVVYPPNMTPDPETGLGRWTEAEIITAVRTGERPDGRLLVVMPWHSYAALTDEDAHAVVLYLKSLQPIRHAAPPLAGESERPQGPYLDLVQP